MSIWTTGPGIYTPVLTIGAFAAGTVLLFNRRIGSILLLIVSTGWLLRYFEHAGYLLLYDMTSPGRWLLTLVPILLAFPIFLLTLRDNLKRINRTLEPWHGGVALVVFLSIGLASFVHKQHTREFNCWYYFDARNDAYRITFAVTPHHILEATNSSTELMQAVKNDGMTYERHDGYYCPETKVEVVTRFKKIVGLKILGFRNSQLDKLVWLDDPVAIDLATVRGDMVLLEPGFSLGD